MRKLVEYFKNDWKSVSTSIRIAYPAVPMWMIRLYYALMLPVALLLLPFAWIYYRYIIYKVNKDISHMDD